nr:hypothetical protein [Tanacetum cinerariifolium]
YQGEKPKFEGKKPEFQVHVSQSSKFEDFSDNNINKVNAIDSPVPAVGQILTDNTNTFSAAGPSNATVSSTHKKSSYVNTSQYTDDPNMPELEDITYSNDEEDVGAEADFTNLETTITVIPIPTTRVHKDHHEELLQFKMQKVWVLVDLPHGKRAIGTKRVFRNKKDERGIVVRNKARLVTQGHTQEDDIDYEEVFAPVARIEAIRMLKVLSCMELLRKRGKIDQTLFIKRQKGDILLVQIYVDDIIFGSTNKNLCKAFEKLLKDKFQMSSMGELTFFLDGKSASTPIYTKKSLLKVPDGEDVDVHTYRSMIGSLMYLTSSRPDIILISWQCKKQTVVATSSTKAEYVAAASCCAQVLWIQNQLLDYGPDQTVSGKDSSNPLMADNLLKIIWYSTYHVALMKSWLVQKKTALGQTTTGKEISNPFMAGSIDCLPNEEIFTVLSRMGYEKPSTKFTFYKAFFSPQWKFLIHTILSQVGDLSSHTTKYSSPALTQQVFSNIRRVGKGFSRVDTPLFEGMIVAHQDDDIADEGAASDVVDDAPAADEPSIPSPTTTTPPPLPSSQDLPSTLQDAKISIDLLHTLLETCTTLTRRVEHLEQDKIAQSLEITKLKQRVKKLERRNKLNGRIIASMDADVDVTLNDAADIAKEVAVDAEIEESADVQGRQAESQAKIYQIELEHGDKVLSMHDDEVDPAELQEVVEVVTTAKLMIEVVTAGSATITAADTLIPAATITAAASRLTTVPSAARRRKGVVIRDPKETATPSTIIHSESKSKDKVQRKEKEDNVVMRYQALKRKPQTEVQARMNMMIYLRNMAGFKMDYFKGMSYDDIHPIFEKKFNSNVAFLEKTREQMEEEDIKALKRTSKSQAEKAAKKQKLDEEVEELKRHLQIVPNDEDDVYIEATPLARKVPVVDYEIYTENNKPYYKIIRADGSP